MITTPTYLRNHELVVSAFGYWPSFHDAKVILFNFEEGSNSAITLTLHGWEMTSEVDENGYFKLQKHHLVKFQFEEILNVLLNQFNSRNILFELTLSSPRDFEAKGLFEVTLDSIMGPELSGSFSARSGGVIDITPCDANGKT